MSDKNEIEDLFGDPKPAPKREAPAPRTASRQPAAASRPAATARPTKPKARKYPSQIEQNESRRQNRITIDPPPGLRDEVKNLAESFDCSMSDLAAYLIMAGLDLYHEGQLDIESLLVPIKSTHSTYGINFEQLPPES